jgi:hypothetical protein
MERETGGDQLAMQRQSVRIRLTAEDQAVRVIDVFVSRTIVGRQRTPVSGTLGLSVTMEKPEKAHS